MDGSGGFVKNWGQGAIIILVLGYFSNQLQQMPHLHSVQLLLLTHLQMVEAKYFVLRSLCTDQCIDQDREVAFFTAGADPLGAPISRSLSPASDPFRRDSMDSINCHDSASHLNMRC